METALRCQSCGMRLGKGFFGTNRDGSITDEYCTFCWQNGEFTKPDQTLDEMIQASVKNMTQDLHMPEEKAQELASAYIPTLKRWLRPA